MLSRRHLETILVMLLTNITVYTQANPCMSKLHVYVQIQTLFLLHAWINHQLGLYACGIVPHTRWFISALVSPSRPRLKA